MTDKMIDMAERIVFLKAHWRKGFWNKPWFWFSFQLWPGRGFAVLICGVEFAALRTTTKGSSDE